MRGMQRQRCVGGWHDGMVRSMCMRGGVRAREVAHEGGGM